MFLNMSVQMIRGKAMFPSLLLLHKVHEAMCRCVEKSHVSKTWQSSKVAYRVPSQHFHTAQIFRQKKEDDSQSDGQKKEDDSESDTRELITQDSFANIKVKNKNNYLDMIHIFNTRSVHKRNHVEFIYAAMKHMDDFGVNKDLAIYKSLIDVFPKGKFVPRNVFQVEFQHYPKQQQCAIDLLEKMEDNGVMPDRETGAMLINVFGKRGHAVRKYARMMYWMPKFKNLSPWLLPNPVPDDALELAKLALQRIGSVDLQMQLQVHRAEDLKDSIDKTWIVSVQSPVQQDLLNKHPTDKPVYVEGAFRVWLRGTFINYFILRSDPVLEARPPPPDDDDVSNLQTPFDDSPLIPVLAKSVHEQEEGTILAMAATGTSSRDSLLSWIRFLQQSNPALGSVPVLFSISSPFGQVTPVVEPDHTQLPPKY